MSDTPTNNYVQLRIPVENAELAFDALCWRYGVNPDEDVDSSDKETCARKALIGVVNNAVTEYRNNLAILEIQENPVDLDIS